MTDLRIGRLHDHVSKLVDWFGIPGKAIVITLRRKRVVHVKIMFIDKIHILPVAGVGVRGSTEKTKLLIAGASCRSFAGEAKMVIRIGPVIGSKADETILKLVVFLHSGQGIVRRQVFVLAVDAHTQAFDWLESITELPGALFFASVGSADEAPVGIRSVFGDDIYDPIDSIGTPDGCAGTANHFNPVDVVHHHSLIGPVNTAIGGVVDGASVDQDQEFGGENRSETANTHTDFSIIGLADFHSRHIAKQIGNIGRARTANVVRVEHRDRGSDIGKFLLLLAG